jgi:hypothetical protein
MATKVTALLLLSLVVAANIRSTSMLNDTCEELDPNCEKIIIWNACMQATSAILIIL